MSTYGLAMEKHTHRREIWGALVIAVGVVACAWTGGGRGGALGQSVSPGAVVGRESGERGESLAKATEAYRTDLMFLANPFLEGRGPGTRGNAIAADYIERRLRDLGLEPAIRSAENEGEVQREVAGFKQAFTAGRSAVCVQQRLIAGAGSDKVVGIERGVVALGFSGSAGASGELVFVGYSIQGGGADKSYSTFAETDDLTGKVCVMLRFEPMNAEGKSVWRKASDGPWTVAAGLSAKIQETLKRGAAGLIIVNTPGADDPRVSKAETTEGTSRWMREIDAPAVLISPEAFEALLTGVGEARTAMQLREAADAAGGISRLGDKAVELQVVIERSMRTTWNVAGVLAGVGELKDEYVIVGAHYDHVGYGYTGGSRTDEYGIVHPGADDNASGTSGLLMAAKELKERFAGSSRARRSIMFVAFSAEEMGLIGSREFVKNCPIDAKNIYAMLNMDMIGRLRDNGLELAGTGTAEEFEEVLASLIEGSGLNVKQTPGGRGPSDHATFYGAGVPVLHFFTGLHEEYHTPRDTAATINFEGAVRTVQFVAETARALSERQGALTFKSTSARMARAKEEEAKAAEDAPAGPSMRNMKIRFGIAPGNYGDENQGVLVDDVFAGTSAAEAGIVKGDVLVKWSGEAIVDVGGWMQQMMKHSPGDVVDVTIKRGGEERVVRVTLKSRDQVAR